MKRLLLPGLILLFLISLSACNKNNRAIRKLDGKWNVIQSTVVGLGDLEPDRIFEFERCKLNQDDYCEFSVHDFDVNTVQGGLFRVSNSGSKLELFWSDGLDYEFQEFDIERLNRRTAILYDSDAPYGRYSYVKLRSIR